MFELYKNYDFNTISSVIGLSFENVTILNIYNYGTAMSKDPNLETINSQICVDKNIEITDISKDTFIEFRNNVNEEIHVFSLAWIDISSIQLSENKTKLLIEISDLSVYEAEVAAQYVSGLNVGKIKITKA